jgi:hypothetical protein
MRVGHQDANNAKPLKLDTPPRIHQRNIVLRIADPTLSVTLAKVWRETTRWDAEVNMLNTSSDLARGTILGVEAEVVGKVIPHRLLISAKIVQ